MMSLDHSEEPVGVRADRRRHHARARNLAKARTVDTPRTLTPPPRLTHEAATRIASAPSVLDARTVAKTFVPLP